MAKTSPGKLAAVAVNYAVNTGKLIKHNACQKCNATNCEIQGHHYNGYENQLDVVWLCWPCHMKVHNKEVGGKIVSYKKTPREPMTAAALKAARLRLGFKNHRALSEALGIPKGTVDAWSTGRRKIPGWVEKFFECLDNAAKIKGKKHA